MSEKIVEEVRKFVEEECLRRGKTDYEKNYYKYHFIPVVKYAKMLAKKLKADEEVVELAALLHDIGIIVYDRREDHHITGAEIAEKKLRELGEGEEKIKLVKKCILNHRGSVESKRESVEEKIIADADAMDHFDVVPYLLIASVIKHGKNMHEAIKSTREKLTRSWNKLSDESREIVKNKYDAAMLLLEAKE